jgi:hypothetical protein
MAHSSFVVSLIFLAFASLTLSALHLIGTNSPPFQPILDKKVER